MNYKFEEGFKEGKKKSNVLVVFCLIGLIMIGGIIGMATSENGVEETTEPMPTRVLQTEEDYLSDEMRESFLVGCMDGDIENYDYCMCAFNYLDRNFTNMEIIEMSFEASEGDVTPSGMVSAMLDCEYLFSY